MITNRGDVAKSDESAFVSRHEPDVDVEHSNQQHQLDNVVLDTARLERKRTKQSSKLRTTWRDAEARRLTRPTVQSRTRVTMAIGSSSEQMRMTQLHQRL